MRSLPILWRMAEDLRRMAMSPSPFFEYPWVSGYRWPPWHHWDQLRVEGDLAKISKNGYQVSMNVSQFKPDELSVKVVEDTVVVEGKSEERRDDQGYISQHFVRRFKLPQGYEAENAISTLSPDGILTVSVPKPESEEQAKMKEIPIQQTGPAARDDPSKA